jgi:hypothetical protein
MGPDGVRANASDPNDFRCTDVTLGRSRARRSLGEHVAYAGLVGGRIGSRLATRGVTRNNRVLACVRARGVRDGCNSARSTIRPDRVGLAYRFSSDGSLEGVSLNFSSLFDR